MLLAFHMTCFRLEAHYTECFRQDYENNVHDTFFDHREVTILIPIPPCIRPLFNCIFIIPRAFNYPST